MPLSNTTQELLRSNPYWDDFRAEKGFHRVLWKPRTPVQTRELNQIQSMLQNQIEQTTSGVFREGAAVQGGQQTVSSTAKSLRVLKQDTINIKNFYDSNTAQGAILRGVTSGAEAIVTQTFTSFNPEYVSFIINPLTSTAFVGGETVNIVDQTTNSTLASMVTAPDNAVLANATTFSVDTGVFFLRGHLVYVNKQTIVLAENNDKPSTRVGFDIEQTVVTSTDDASLLDPALGTTNYAAPGADRLKLRAILTTRPWFIGNDDSNSDGINANEDFIELGRVVDGVLQFQPDRVQADLLENTLARRTYDESGDYVVRPFRLTTRDHNPPLSVPNITGVVTGNTASEIIVGGTIVSTVINEDGTTTNVTTLFDSQIAAGDTLVVRGERRTVTSILSNTALIVDAPYSEDFTNEIATVISPNKLNLELEAGKAYVRGYEFETTGTTKLEAPRARTTETIDNGYIGTNFGPFVYVTRDAGVFDTSTHELVDLHSVSYDDILSGSPQSYAASKIGTARVRSFLYDSGNGDANTVYKLYLVGAEFTTKTYSVTGDADSDGELTAVARSINSTSATVTLTQNMTTEDGDGTIVPYANNAYTGATIQLTTTSGTKLVYTILSSVVERNSTEWSHTLTVDGDDNLLRVNTSADVTIIFNDKCIRGMSSNIALTTGATVDSKSKFNGVSTGYTLVQGTTSPGLLYRFRGGYINTASIIDESYSLLRYYRNIQSTVDSGLHTFVLPASTNETAVDPTLSSAANYIAAAAMTTGETIYLDDSTVSRTGNDIQLTIPTTSIPDTPTSPVSIDVYAPMVVSNASPRIKTLRLANTAIANVQISGGNLTTDISRGHIAINQITANSPRIVGLGVADVYRLQKVYAVKNGFGDPLTDTVVVDVTDRYTLDNGQRDWCYDHASLVLKPGFTHYTTGAGRLVVMVDVFEHSTITGNAVYFTAESYSGFAPEDIPRFENPKTGISLDLWNYLDFRPVRVANAAYANTATNPYTSADTVFKQTMLPLPVGTYTADYEYYLPRIDKIVLTKDRTLRVLQGTPAPTPVPPPDDTNGITLYLVSYPPYTANASLLNVVPFEYKRYTMKDIGKLEKRIENLEYYTSLSTLDIQASSSPEYDDNDIERFKNGIITDAFSNQAIANFKNSDTKIALDTRNQEMRPSFDTQEYQFSVNRTASVGVQGLGIYSLRNSGLMTLPFTTTPFVSQGLATTSININPFNVISWIGSLSLLPPSDTFIDTIVKPTVIINQFNENDGLQEGEQPLGTTWNMWETFHFGESKRDVSAIYPGRLPGATDPTNPHPNENPGGVRDQKLQDIIMVTPVTHTQMRQPTTTYQKVSVQSVDLGEKVIDVAVAPKMRGRTVDIVADGLLPGSTLRATFDGIDVTAYVQRANEIHLANADLASLFRVGDYVLSPYSPEYSYRTRIIGITGNVLRVVDGQGSFAGALISLDTSVSLSSVHVPAADETRSVEGVKVDAYMHWSGVAQQVTKNGGVYAIKLDNGAPGDTDPSYYVGKTIYFNDGGYIRRVNPVTGSSSTDTSGLAGEKAVITAYDGVSKFATLNVSSPSLRLALDAQVSSYTSDAPIRYSIGDLRVESALTAEEMWRVTNQNPDNVSPTAVQPGTFFGVFHLPGSRILSATDQSRYLSSPLTFDTGVRIFKLENVNPDTESYALSPFMSTGSTVTKQKEIVRTRELTYRTEIGETQTSSYTEDLRTVDTQIVGYYDPLAQTFLVSKTEYPDGVFVTHIDLFFAKKGSTQYPVTVQIRPTVNGYPAADGILAEGKVYGSSINVVPAGVTPNINDSTHRTRVYFDDPTYLASNVEYAVVIMANTQEYEVFIAEIGKPVIGTTSIVAQQPLGGVFFKSQNARTWTAEQTQDLMFVLHRAEFTTAEGTLGFKLRNEPRFHILPLSVDQSIYSSIQPFEYDLLQINTGHIEFEPTRNYTTLAFSARNTNDIDTVYPLSPGINLTMPDRKKIVKDDVESLLVSAHIKTRNPHVSPVFDVHRVSAVAVKNRIDNGQLYGNGFQITQGTPTSQAYSNSYPLSIVGGNGSGAEIYANTNASGYITSIFVVNAGSGYTETPVVTFPSTGDYADDFSLSPTVSYIGETSPSSGIKGEQKARYIMRTVTLADGFDAGDLKVYLSASRSQADNIDVYYKVLATGDPQRFDDKSWTLMALKPGQETLYSTSAANFREYEYRTVGSTATYTYNNTIFDRFHTFAIKVVLRSTNTTIVPRVKNLRVIALDE